MNLKRLVCALLLLAIPLGCCGCGSQAPASETTAPETAPPPTVKLTFSPNNGDGSTVIQAVKGELVPNVLVPQKRGCDFVGWFYNDKLWDPAVEPAEKNMTLTAKWTLSSNAFDMDPNAGVRAEGTDVRVCNFNILSPIRGAMHPLAQRPAGLKNMALSYQPDIIALQEYDAPWHEPLLEALADTSYRLVSGDSYKIDGYNATRQLIYRTDKLTLVEFGQNNCAVGTYNGRFVWALFETKDDAKQRFLAVSVHWYWDSADTRLEEAKLFCDWLAAAKATYQVPTIVMGDFNANEGERSYTQMLKTAQLQDAKYQASARGLVSSTYHTNPSPERFDDEKVNTLLSIDHIVYTDDLQALYYDTIMHEEILKTSDHNPIYTDFKFTSQS